METNEQVPMVHFSDDQNARYAAPQIDPGEKTARNSRIFGIIALVTSFLFPGIMPIIFAVLGITYCGNYKKTGTGQNLPLAETGRKCSIAAICITAAQILLSIILVLVFFGIIGEISQNVSNMDWSEFMRSLE